jgi:hypothetical protein
MASTDIDYRLTVKDTNVINTLTEVIKRVKEVNKDFKVLEKLRFDHTEKEINDVTKSTKQLEKAAENAGDALDDIDGTIEIDVKGADKLKSIDTKGGSKLDAAQGAMGGITDIIGDPSTIVNKFSDALSGMGKNGKVAAIAVAAIGGAIVAVSADINKGVAKIKELKKALSSQTGLKGDELKEASIMVKSLVDTFGNDEDQLIKTINAVSKNRKISFETAAKIVGEQLNSGLSAEGLAQWAEYDVQAQKRGLSARETGAFIKSSEQMGIHADKGIDALKEAGLKLSEYSEQTRESLMVLGADFVSNLEKDIKNGKDDILILKDIYKRADEKLSKRDKEKLTTALASAAGEDAGRFGELILSFKRDGEKGGEVLTEQQKASNELLEAYKSLNTEYAKFGDAAGTTSLKLNTFFINLKANFYETLSKMTPAFEGMISFFGKMVDSSKPFVDSLKNAWQIAKEFANELWGLITDYLPSFSNSTETATSVMKGLSKFFDIITLNSRAFLSTLTLIIKAFRVFVNSAKEGLNFLGADFKIDPELSMDSLKKDFAKYKKDAGNLFKVDIPVENETDKKAKEEKETIQKFGGGVVAAQSGEPEKYEIKITADLKPFEEALKKVQDDIRILNENAVVKEIQFKTSVDALVLQRSVEMIERAKIESEQKVSRIQFENTIEQTRREVELRKKTAIETLDKGKEDDLKGINELKTASLKVAKKKELEKKYTEELKKINEISEKERLEQEKLYVHKREELYLEQNRAFEISQITTINEQKKRISEDLKTQVEYQKNAISNILSESTLFNQRREFELSISIKNKDEIAKGLDAELEKIDSAIANFKGSSNPKDLEIVENLQQERINTIIAANNKIIDENNKFIKTKQKIDEQELTIQKDKFEKQTQQTQKFIENVNKSFDKLKSLGDEYRSRLDPKDLALNTNSVLTSLNNFTDSTLKNLSGFFTQIDNIKRKNLEKKEIDLGAKSLQEQIDALEPQISRYNKILFDSLGEGDNKTAEAAKKQRDNLKDQQRALIDQKRLLVGDTKELKEHLDLIRKQKSDIREALSTGVDVSTGEQMDDSQREKAKDALKAADENEKELQDKLEKQADKLRKLGEDKKQIITEFVISTAEVVGNAVFDALKAGTQATIDAIDIMLEKQQERVTEIAEALKEGGEAAQNYSAEQLEIEQNRAAEMEKQRAEEASKMQQYTVMQIALNGAIAIARTFAEYPFPISLGVAALQIAAIIGTIAAMTAQAKTVKAEKGILDINSEKLNSKGQIKGRRHSEGGVMIEAEGGETIVSRANTSKYKTILEKIHEDTITTGQLSNINSYLNNKQNLFTLPKIETPYIFNISKPSVKIIDENKDVVFQLKSLRNDLKQYDRNNEKTIIIKQQDNRMRMKTQNT